jgi:hypothetical protein
MEQEKETQNGKMKFTKRAKETQHGEVTEVFPSGQFQERQEADVGVFRCEFCGE